MRKDLLHAARGLWQSPVFALTAILTIALGIGASTAIFSVTNAVLLRPLPYKDPERLVLPFVEMRARHIVDGTFSADGMFDLRKTATTFEEIAALFTFRGSFPADDGTPEQVGFGLVTPNFFRTLGAHMAAGRDFAEADGLPQPPADPAARAAGTAPPRLPAVSILSYEYWQRRYGRDPNVIGRTVNGSLIVGVAEPGFELLLPPFANIERKPEVWTALRLVYDQSQRLSIGFRLIGRLKPGATIDQAQAQSEIMAADERKINLIERSADYHVRLDPMHKDLVAEVRPAIIALMGAVIFLLLIACANVANLLMVRSSLRERELSVRTALGASRWRLMRQMLAESVVIAGCGTAVGLGLAKLGIHQLIVMGPTNLPRLGSIAIDPTVLMFSMGAGLVAAAIFGVVPALRASRPDVMQVLRGSGRTASLGGGRALRNAAVVIEVALSFVLLIGSGLMFRSFVALQHIDRGYDSPGLLTLLVQGVPGKTPEERASFVHDLQSRLGGISGVQSVSAASPFPLDGRFNPLRWGKEDALGDPSKFQAADCELVLPGYFETMKTRLIEGRTFTDADNDPKRNLVVIDEMLAKKAFPHESAIGKRLLIRLRTPEAEFVEIIGVVAHERQASLAQEGREQYYLTDGFAGHGAANRWVIRTSGDPGHFVGVVRAEMAKLDAHLPVFEVQPMDVLVEKAAAGTRFSLMLIGVFAAIAVLLAGVGLYGVLSTMVRQRTSEIGVRMALGAAPTRIFNLVIGHGLRLSAMGIGVGIFAALGLTRVMSSMLVGVKASDPVTYLSMAALFFAITAVACWMPGRRAAGLDPLVALRDE
ncbi:MAG TPA: ABC transporter permease [Bryobacteraceae bacterium]|jgi:predicted permease|nr:ABC transporter permease [Bryobacteraceae bacterium]